MAGAVRRARPVRLGILILAAVLAGVIADWLHADQRLLFPRPLPVFSTRDSGR